MTTRGSLSGVLCAGLFLSTWVGAVSAFELETHKRISETAFFQSTLGKGYLESELKLSPTMLLTWGTQTRRAQEWIGEGSVREDDGLRPLGHFYDPVRERGFTSLSLPCVVQGPAAPDWAFDQPTEPADLQFSWRVARESFYRALTGKFQTPDRYEMGREENLARTFRALGDVLHLVQDMGSPEHTRNDAHANIEILDKVFCGAESLFETRIDQIRGTFTYTGYATPQLQRFRDAWTTNDGRGLAEYTNRNFVSKDTNFTRAVDGNRAKDYSQPQLNLAYREDVLASDLGIPAPFGPFPVTFFGNFVDDRITGESPAFNPRMTTYSLFDRDLKLRDRGLIFTLNRFNVEAAAGFLLPRAVGYSAALLDYFFRGKLEATIEADPADPEKLQLTAKNASSEALGRGTLAMYGDYSGGERRPLGSWPIEGPVAPGDALPSQSFRPDTPIPARYIVVYQGDLGEEKKDNPPGFAGAVIGKAAKYGGVMEELILFRTPSNTYDVYFRNANRVVLLELSENLPVVAVNGAAPPEVHWGVDSNHFFVKNYEIRTVAGYDIGVPVYWIYKIDRPDNSVSGDEPVQVRLVKTIRPPATPLPYGYRETWVNREQWNRTGQVVYPYGTVITAPLNAIRSAPSEQEVLSEDLGNGSGLEIYALFRAEVYDEINYVDASGEGPGGGGWGLLGVSLIMQASTGAIIYEDPISGSYKAQVAAAASRGDYAVAQFSAWPRTWIVSWSDKDVKKRRWVTQLQADDYYLTYDWTRERGYTNQVDYFVENSVQTVLIEDGQPKFSITPKRTYVEIVYDRTATRFYPAALVPTMSSEKWLWVDEPDVFTADENTDVDILRRTQYLMSTETGAKQRVGEWTPLDETQFLIAPKIREMIMLQPGFLYAYGEPVYALPNVSDIPVSFFNQDWGPPLAQDFTAEGEKQKFVRFLLPDGQIDPAFTTAAPLLEDPDLRGKGRVRTDSYPPGFQTVLDALLNLGSATNVSWHVVPDPDLVPARRR